MESNRDEEPAVFQLQNANLNKRSKDVFSSLDELEQKHREFERTRAKEDADSDKRLMYESASQDDLESTHSDFKRPSFSGRDYCESRKGGRHGHEGRDQTQSFRKPMPPPSQQRGRYGSGRGRYGRGRATPDYKLHPERWTEYSLEDVDVSDTSNKRAAFDFLEERRKMREEGLKEEAMDLETTACSKGQVTFKKPSKDKIDNSGRKDKVKGQVIVGVENMDYAFEDGDSSSQVMKAKDSSKSENGGTGVKRKLDIEDIMADSEETADSGSSSQFKVRKIRKRNFRSQRDHEDSMD